jgi:hypothetical protein
MTVATAAAATAAVAAAAMTTAFSGGGDYDCFSTGSSGDGVGTQAVNTI